MYEKETPYIYFILFYLETHMKQETDTYWA